jgi:hypothetical protein
MSMSGLTPEQRQLIEQAGDQPVRIEDPETQHVYVVLRAEVYERVRDLLELRSAIDLGVPEGIRTSQEAFWRDLQHLLSERKLRGRWVCYHGDDRIGIGTHEALIRECLCRGLPDDSYHLDRIVPRELPPWEPEEVEPLGAHHLEDSHTES